MNTTATKAAITTASRSERYAALGIVFVPFIGVLVAVVGMWGWGVGMLDLWLCLAMYCVSVGGITMGFHRLFTHRSFQCVRPLRAALCIAGCMAAQGPVLFWVACHRRHHQHSDDERDPHSPHYGGGGWRGILRGCWHSHMGWMLSYAPENYFRRVPDLVRDPLIVQLNRLYNVWLVAGLLLPGVVGGLVSGTWKGFFTGILWGGFVRIFLAHHTTWSINSICHMFGQTPFATKDESRNNFICALLTFGEGWHNNHHAFPNSARHGLRWWQPDLVFMSIRVLKRFRLAWDVELPTAEQLLARSRLPETPA